MGIKKRSKVSATFNMSSLTDIIFLLLIFFMLTSSLVAPTALNLKLPGTSRSEAPSTGQIDNVAIGRQGNYYLNGERITLESLEQQLRRLSSGRRGQLTITIWPDAGRPVEYVVAVMDIAMRYDINGVLAAQR